MELYGLTRREEMILRCLVDGLEADVICQNACITNNTLKNTFSIFTKKLGIRNRVQMFKLVKEKRKLVKWQDRTIRKSARSFFCFLYKWQAEWYDETIRLRMKLILEMGNGGK